MKKNIKHKKRNKLIKKNNIILITALLIIIISIFSTNLKDLTGKTIDCSILEQTDCETDTNCQWDDITAPAVCKEAPSCDPACSDPTPICNQETNTCVQCLNNDDCNPDPQIFNKICFNNKCLTLLQGYFCNFKELLGEDIDDANYIQYCE